MDIRNFPVTVFGSILGTGGVILASRPFLPQIVMPMSLLLLVLFLFFTGLLLLKAVRFPVVVRSELQHPLPGNFYALQPISAVILSILCMHVLPAGLDIGLLIYGAIFILALSVYLPYHFFSDMNISFSQLHGGWFITPVATILVTDALMLYPMTEISMVAALFFFGIGSILFLLVLSVLFFRLLSHGLPPNDLAPTNYIMLAPIGILIVDFIQISTLAGKFFGSDLTTPAVMIGTAVWGFGLWAALVNLLLIIKYVRNGLKFHAGWWSYVFPTAAFTLASMELSAYIPLFSLFSRVLYIVLLLVFILVVIGSLDGLVRSHHRSSLQKSDKAI